MRNHKILKLANPHVHIQNTFHKELGISKVLAQVLANRGITNIKEAENFLNVKLEHLLDPYSFSDMHKAVGLVKKAAQEKEKLAQADVDLWANNQDAKANLFSGGAIHFEMD